MNIWSNDIQCARDYMSTRGGAGLLDEHEQPYNWSTSGENFDDVVPLYGSQVHLTRVLTGRELIRLREIESQFDMDGDWPQDGEPWDKEMHTCWLNFDYFSAAARAYLESLPD